jgi:hypothetical protein
VKFRVVPLTEEHVEGFRAALDVVAKERRYLLFLKAPPLAQVRKFVRGSIRKKGVLCSGAPVSDKEPLPQHGA